MSRLFFDVIRLMLFTVDYITQYKKIFYIYELFVG